MDRPGHKEVILPKNCLPNNPSFLQWIIFVLSEDYSDVFSTYLISRIAGEVESIILDPVTQTSVHLPPVVPATGRTTHPIILVIPSIILYSKVWCVGVLCLRCVTCMTDTYAMNITGKQDATPCTWAYTCIWVVPDPAIQRSWGFPNNPGKPGHGGVLVRGEELPVVAALVVRQSSAELTCYCYWSVTSKWTLIMSMVHMVCHIS